ncbi:MAG: DUF4405 domain-containing protein [Planctomycetaceae bacterium]
MNAPSEESSRPSPLATIQAEARQQSGTPVSTTEARTRLALLHHDDHEHTAPLATRPPGRISRTLVNFWLDTVLGGLFVALCITAVIVQFVFPPGVAARGAMLLGMNYGQWCSFQFAQLAILGLGILVHVMLHWTWVCSVMTKRILGMPDLPDDGIRTIYGVGLLIGLLLLGAVCVGAAQWMIVLPS